MVNGEMTRSLCPLVLTGLTEIIQLKVSNNKHGLSYITSETNSSYLLVLCLQNIDMKFNRLI
jgi:hypothetical protein